MNENPEVSVVIVSLGRRDLLERVLLSLSDLDYRPFEVVVVADVDPSRVFPNLPNVTRIRYVRYDRPNISIARNLGIAASGGAIIAFIDDDSVPEPTWLSHLVAPFSDPEVAASGGFVRGRNGISFQWKASTFDCTGQRQALDLVSDDPVVLQGDAETGIKTEGTNCAFRRDVLSDLGGFDEGFSYYLEETDLNYRLGLAGWKTAIVPRAQVHHGYAANRVRDGARAPSDLFEIGASQARFLTKHCQKARIGGALQQFRTAQRIRLLEHMVAGRLEPFSISPLLTSLDRGMDEGRQRKHVAQSNLSMGSKGFQPFATSPPKTSIAVWVRWWRGKQVQKVLEERYVTHLNITFFSLSLTGLLHRMEYRKPGIWWQSGGLFGRSDRRDPLFKLQRFRTRAARECKRIGDVRPVRDLHSFSSYLAEQQETP